jgi:hypothetical protein
MVKAHVDYSQVMQTKDVKVMVKAHMDYGKVM